MLYWECGTCEGLGYVVQDDCELCRGRGFVPVDPDALRPVVMAALDDLHAMDEYGSDREADAVLAALDAGRMG